MAVTTSFTARVAPPWRALHRKANQARDQVANDVEMGDALVVGEDYDPWRKRIRGSREHQIPSLSIGVPVLQCDFVDRTRFPLLQRVTPPVTKALFLLLFADIQVIFHNLNSGTDEHVLE